MRVNHCPCWQLFCQELGQAAWTAQVMSLHEKLLPDLQLSPVLLIPETLPSLSPRPACCSSLFPTPPTNSASCQLQPPAQGDHRVWHATPPQPELLLPSGGYLGELPFLKRCKPLLPGRMSWSYHLWNTSSISLRMHRTEDSFQLKPDGATSVLFCGRGRTLVEVR